LEKFDQTVSYKLIYVISMPYETHKGLLKVGEATLNSDLKPSELAPNCRLLNQAAKKRIGDYTKTASINYTLLYTELAEKTVGDRPVAFSDKNIHDVLVNSGIHKVQPNGATGEEWFLTDLETVKNAIAAVKAGKDTLSSNEIASSDVHTSIDFREEQLDAINRTIATFKKENDMLWFAKMRYGKTLTALEVIRRLQYRRVIIVTHRPVVDDSWSGDFNKIFFPGNSEHEYHYERKTQDSAYIYDEKTDAENDLKIRKLDKDGDYFIYFASIQDLRGSKLVGGSFNKNNAVFELDWDMIVIDEAHEGTQTELGDSVITKLRKKKTKMLALSGTPFNLLDKYNNENVYTWDYVMEQKKKEEWDLKHPGDHNPYADLPKMHIYTYDLGERLKQYVSDEYDTKAFNFREFFRVWDRGPSGRRDIPTGKTEGKFVHENDVTAFLNLLIKEDNESGYPFSTKEYREMFRHTLWMVPGVREARALSELLRSHPIFGEFGIANVAGEGDRYEEEHAKDALELVRSTIKNNRYSITLSCGKLTTGVTVKEWTAVLMLSGSYSTAAAQYMQTIFRVQSAGSIDGKQKTDCFVFDFAPDRTLKVLTETVNLSRKPGKSRQKSRDAMAEFLNYCPVISITGSKTRKYSVESMMEQIKQIYAERAVNSGFDDESIYNSDELLKLNAIETSKFNNLKDIIGLSKAEKKKTEVIVNAQGLTDEEIEHADDPNTPPKGPEKPPLTPEEIARRKRIMEAKAARKKAIDILRGISIRMPLLIYGADVPMEEDIGIERFVDLVDDESWKEFMPQGVTKQLFGEFIKYYDRDVFIAAGKRIRRLAAAADRETPTRRVNLIAEIFRHFRNPDKETVLTPWRVVNMHMSDTIGGWCFFNEKFEDDTSAEKHRLEEPRFVDRGDVTKTVFAENAKILEINSKTGLYPLYVAYSFYKQRMEGMSDDDWEPDECRQFWDEVIRDNVYVICKTPMAKSITRRTLCGYGSTPCNAHYFKNLVSDLKNEPEKFKSKVLKGSTWKKDVNKMKFDAVVGNPPYQANLGGASALPVYHYFVLNAKELKPKYISMITPARWFNTGTGLDSFREEMLHDTHISVLHDFIDATECFTNVEIKGGIEFFLWDKSYDGKCNITTHKNGAVVKSLRYLVEEGMDSYIRNSHLISLLNKVKEKKEPSFADLISSRDPFGYDIRLPGSMKVAPHKYSLEESEIDYIKFYYNGWRKEGIGYVTLDSVNANKELIDKYKILIPKAWGTGREGKDWLKPFIVSPPSVCTETYLVVGGYDNIELAQNVVSYMQTKLFHVLVSLLKISQNAAKGVYQLVPQQDFSKPWTDEELYAKYGLTDEEIAFIESTIKPME
jgi:superfamily II DNA or RNA helicase